MVDYSKKYIKYKKKYLLLKGGIGFISKKYNSHKWIVYSMNL